MFSVEYWGVPTLRTSTLDGYLLVWSTSCHDFCRWCFWMMMLLYKGTSQNCSLLTSIIMWMVLWRHVLRAFIGFTSTSISLTPRSSHTLILMPVAGHLEWTCLIWWGGGKKGWQLVIITGKSRMWTGHCGNWAPCLLACLHFMGWQSP